MFSTSGRGLEIGPSYNPLLPKSEGFDVEILDHATADELRAKYKTEPVDCSRIEDVDHIWDGRSLPEIIGQTTCYDYIVASHVIEHTPDILGFLKDCDSLLKPDGALVLAVPDKRRCFDVFRPLSTTGAVLQAHLERRARHIPAVAFDQVAYAARLDGVIGWSESSTGNLALENDLSFAQKIYERTIVAKEYYDFHAWTFCPSSFRMITNDLYEIGALALREDKFLLTPGVEFFITLSRLGPGCSLTRQQLLLQAQEELREFPAAKALSAAPG
jgi:SAM-dependent methyltransferase